MIRVRKRTVERHTEDDISLADVYVAYRKAKSEAYYESTHVHAIAFTQYEQNLRENLRSLHAALIGPQPTWPSDLTFIGGYAYVPKSLDDSCWKDNTSGHFRAMDPIQDWSARFRKGKKRAKGKLRLVIEPTVNFQIISALWIMKVGQKFDSALDPSLAFANRIRRAYRVSNGTRSSRRVMNLGAVGLFEPYFSAYQEWRENGLKAIESSLLADKNILAITMDVEQFYHRVNPECIVRRGFLERLGIELTDAELFFTKQLLAAISVWYRATPDYAARPQGAIPVGLSASKVISNVLLADFDRVLLRNVQPIYYGRYVDDLFLVFENRDELAGAKAVARWLSRKMGRLMSVEADEGGAPSLRLNLPYANDSELIFRGAKQKTFALSSSHGLDLVQHIRDQIRAQSSEYRLLPVLPETGSEMASRALLLTPDAKLQVDALRKADVVSVRRMGLALLLRDLEVFSFDLQPSSWSQPRNEFYDLVRRHALSPEGFFEFSNYLPRVFGLMISCNDYEAADAFVQTIAELAKLLKRTTNLGQRAQSRNFGSCVAHLAKALKQAAIQAATRRAVRIDLRLLRTLRSLKELNTQMEVPSSADQLRKLVRQVLLADWGSRPYKDYWYLDQAQDEPGPPIPKEQTIRRRLRIGGIRQFRKLSAGIKVPHWPALVFPTRPMRVDEISLVAPEVLGNTELYRKFIMILRGAQVVDQSQVGFDPPKVPGGAPQYFVVPHRGHTPVRVAVTSFGTSDSQWNKAATGKPDRTWQRYANLNILVNRMLQEQPRPSYIVFPELSIPLRWALRIARKLAANSVSFVAGIEYHRDKATQRLRNDALVSLTTRWPGYASNIVRLQPKFAPAHEEKKQLLGVSNALYRPSGKDSRPTVYRHGGYCFAVLVCSDLTNIEHRNLLKGYIDTLYVLEWNPDVKTFASLVESTAFDLHTFITQANNRRFGDSRIRCPAKEEYRRDVVQVKGGESDFYVIGIIDYLELRKEQRTKQHSFFKPMPIGFTMSDFRRASKP